MADEGYVVRGIDWRQAFPFTHIFRAFRIAIHPSKLILGLILLLTVYVGGRILDGVWARNSRAVPEELALYTQANTETEFDEARAAVQRDIEENYAFAFVELGVAKEVNVAQEKARAGALVEDARKAAIKRRQTEIDTANTDYDKAVAALKTKYPNSDQKEQLERETDAARLEHDSRIDTIDRSWRERLAHLESVKGIGLFRTFFEYELNQFSGVVQSVLGNQWLSNGAIAGVGGHVYNFIAVGPVWLIRAHTVFAVLFALLFLAAWSLFGGAISRIAAIHVARDEKISVRQAVNFAMGKFLSFASAPVIPLLIVIVVGLAVTIASLVGNIPYIGPIVIGAAFVLALLAGFVMTLVILGTLGGFNLMYPTVAVEGSDSFDAISRSFSYVYARPWRMLLYTAVAVGYGAITYLFVRLFITMILMLTHHFVGMGILLSDSQRQSVFSSMWPDPATTGRLTYASDFTVLNWGEQTGAVLMSLWIYLLIGLLGAFAISFYFSSNTIIYFLMRHELDATELDDVYLEQSDDEFGEPGSVGTETPGVVTPAAAPLLTPASAGSTSTSSAVTRTTDIPVPAVGESIVIKSSAQGGSAIVTEPAPRGDGPAT